MGKLIGYGKIGRSMPLTLDKCGNLGGDVEMVAVVKELALRHPEDEFVLVGRNTGEHPAEVGLPGNVTNPWTRLAPLLRKRLNEAGLNKSALDVDGHYKVQGIFNDLIGHIFPQLDALVLWIGQHGTTNTPLPGVAKDGVTKPHDSFAYYAGYLLRGVNRFRDRDPFNYEEIYLNADSRNYLKMRDLAWPLRHPVLTQMTYEHKIRNEREHRDLHGYAPWGAELIEKNGHKLWQSTVKNVYSRLEVNGLRPGTPFGDLISYDDRWEGRGHFGLFINEARSYVGEEVKRLNIMRDWILPLEPTWVHGTWSKKSLAELGMEIEPAPWSEYYPRLHSVRSTFTTPSSGSGFATAKPWEAFAAGTVCFFHPRYDEQDNILGDTSPELRKWLRADSPAALAYRVRAVNEDEGLWRWIITEQRKHFDNAMSDLTYVKMIEDRIYT